MTVEMPLLEKLAARMNCEFISDLHYLPNWQRFRLAREIERIPCGSATLWEWNDALSYLVSCEPERSAEEAKTRLLSQLTIVDGQESKTG